MPSWGDEQPARFMSDITGKFFCENCFDDSGLTKFFNGSYAPKRMGECSYCELDFDEDDDPVQVEVMEVTKLQELLRSFLGHSYNDAGNELLYNGREGGFQGETTDAYDILGNEFSVCLCDGMIEDFIQASDDQIYTNRDYAIERPAGRWLNGWEEFKNTIKHKYRFFFGQVGDLSEDRHPDYPNPLDFFSYFDTAVKKLQVINIIDSDQVFYRCRIVDRDTQLSTFEEIGPPPAEFSKFTNRFSPSGIPMFYAGCDKEICLQEIDWEPKEGKKIVTGEFRLKKPIKILDINSAQWPEGCFDPDWIGQYHIQSFFRGMIKDMTAPVIKDGSEHIDYIPTQIICEYLRYFKEEIEGICFPSSRDITKKSYVFFWDCKQSKEYMELINLSEDI